ncbi:hypothetical protein ABXT06_11945 [Flavobacterium sp. UW10123]|uniref:hypothetical protein n=1 Tax=Flavobacterium sp. UW10123 TaxID=3230800 RepID=UPI003397CEF4
MKTNYKWNILCALIFCTAIGHSQKNAPEIPVKRIYMEFADQNQPKKYECTSIHYKTNLKGNDPNDNYDMAISGIATTDIEILEWANSSMPRTIKVSVINSQKLEREYILENAEVRVFRESNYSSNTNNEINSNFDFTINSPKIIINGIRMKGSK